jgi:hypothetical protein
LSKEFNAAPAKNAASVGSVTGPRGTAQPGTLGTGQGVAGVGIGARFMRGAYPLRALLSTIIRLIRTLCLRIRTSDNVALSDVLHFYRENGGFGHAAPAGGHRPGSSARESRSAGVVFRDRIARG